MRPGIHSSPAVLLTDCSLRDRSLVTTRSHSTRGGTLRKLKERLSDDQGMTTAEYAVGTVAVAGLGGLFIKLLTSDSVRDLLWGLFKGAFSFIGG
jgi:hypothetical protein